MNNNLEITFTNMFTKWVYSIDIADTNLLSIFYEQFPDLDKLINNLWINLNLLNPRALYALKKIYYLALKSGSCDVTMFYFNDVNMKTNMVMVRGKHRVFYLEAERETYMGKIESLRYYLAKDNGSSIYANRV